MNFKKGLVKLMNKKTKNIIENIDISSKIFNIKEEFYLRDIINARKMAVDNGFELFKFNDFIYFIDRDKNLHKTKLL